MSAACGEARDGLSRLGADARAEDLRGNTPAHLAAGLSHLAVLTLLLQKEPKVREIICG